jgi:LmbE family N-acetylglucosaminyl deacetylase
MSSCRIAVSLGVLLFASGALLAQRSNSAPPVNPADISEWRGKTVMLFSPHPDDDLEAAGAMARLVRTGNKIIIVIYCTGNKGTHDVEMTSERLAEIRHQEDLAANKIIGIPPENIVLLGYDDGMLEYVPPTELLEKVCRLVRQYRPDAIFSFDPGSPYMMWLKTDHRMAAFMTVDAARAAAFPLFFPSHRIYGGLEQFTIRDFFFWSSEQPNVRVDITGVAELKFRAATQHASQFGQGNMKYTGPVMDPAGVESMRAQYMRKDTDGKIYERFRRLQESLAF